jgi:hypothetical protein
MQLGDLDSQVTDQMNTQTLDLNQRKAVESVQMALEKFGDQGPQNGDDMHTCVQAFQDAIASLQPGDPVAAQLQQQLSAMVSQYGYQDVMETPTAPGTLAPPRQALLPAGTIAFQYPRAFVAPTVAPSTPAAPASPSPSKEAFLLGKPPQNSDWKGTVDAVGNLATDIKSNAEIQMLTLQDLVSQRQQVVELATGMMSKEDQALDDGAKAIGQ